MDTLIERKPGINRKRLYWVGGVMLGLPILFSEIQLLLWQWRKTG
jgi:hypothetical protein